MIDVSEYLARVTGDGCRHPWELARLNLVAGLLAPLLQIEGGLGRHVVDVGCGDGFLCADLARRMPQVRFYGVDKAFDDDLLHAFRKRCNWPNLSLHHDLAGLAGITDHVDGVLLLYVLEHVEDDAGFSANLPLCHY